jgi:hypothetical protein
MDRQDVEFKVTVERIDRRIPDPEEEPTLTAKRYAAIMGVGLRSVYAAIDAGQVPCIRVGRRVVIPTRQALASLLRPDGDV